MNEQKEKNPYGITIFRPGVSSKSRKIKIIFFLAMCGVLFFQSCYWLFANSTEPILLGMPFCMFFIVMFIAIQFILLLILYFFESKEMKD